MRLSVERVRWVLVAGALLLVVVLVAYLGFGRYRALRAYQRILARSGVSVTRDTNGVTYSQSVGGKTIFTIHAGKATQIGNGKWALHNVDMTLYGKAGERPDHIYGAEFEYDEKEGVARALGEVHMDLEAPQSLKSGGRAVPGKDAAQPAVSAGGEGAEGVGVIHVRTSRVVYLRKLGVAATDQPVEFRYGGMQCTAKGAEFNTGMSTLHLLADVTMDGLARGRPVHLTASRADLDRTMNVANVAHPVVTSDGRSAKADAAELEMRKDGSIERVTATGGVTLSGGTREVTAARLEATLNPQALPEKARLSGGVVLMDSDPQRPMHGVAKQVDAAFNAQGAVTSTVATGAVDVLATDKKEVASGLVREVKGEKLVTSFVPVPAVGNRRVGSRMSEVHVTGGGRARGESVAVAKPGRLAGLKTVEVVADDLRMVFGAGVGGRAEAKRMYGVGHTELRQDAPGGEQEVSTGETLEAAFAETTGGKKGAMTIASATQDGHVEIHSRGAEKVAADGTKKAGALSRASAERAVYDGGAERVTLSGGARLAGETASVMAPTVVLDQRTGDAEAKGGVQTTVDNADGAVAGGGKVKPVTHVLSASARFEHDGKVMEFRGTDAEPAKMWQEASQVQAATLVVDGERRTFSARPGVGGGMVHAVFAGSAKPGTGAGKIVRVTSPKMDYNDGLREATFLGGVRMEGSTGDVRSERAVVFLTPAVKAAEGQPSPLEGSLERVVTSGDVVMEQPGRQGSGEQLLYTAATESYVLTGTAAKPPRVVDAKQGNVTGATLLFGDAGSTIVVAGEATTEKSAHGRVRTETEVKQQEPPKE